MNISQTENKDYSYLKINNVVAGQTPNSINIFSEIIDQFDIIIEIGSGRGALSFWIFNNKKTDATFVSYDINKKRNCFLNTKIDFRFGDCFTTKNITEIKQFIQTPNKRVLLLCDGGNKEKEFNTFGPMLKSNDVIMAHDYSDNLQEYTKLRKKINWPTQPETNYENIKKTVNESELKPFNYDKFKNVIWGSFIKI